MKPMRSIDAGKMKKPERVDAGPAPILQWLKIADLVVDDDYQRELKPGNWKVIQRIAAAFTWSRFSPVFVAPIEGGKYAIIDGQHRTHAAHLVGIAEVPCQIVPMDKREQAAAFAAVNGMVTRVTVWQVYKAALAAGVEWAAKAERVARAGGCELMTDNASHYTKQPGQIYGVSSFREIVEKYPEPAVVGALKILMATDGWRDAPESWDTSILKPVLAALCRRPMAIAREDFSRRFEMFDIWTIADRITAENKDRIRKGLPYAPKKERLETETVDWIDRTFPERVAIGSAA